jgi:hypothetical protein
MSGMRRRTGQTSLSMVSISVTQRRCSRGHALRSRTTGSSMAGRDSSRSALWLDGLWFIAHTPREGGTRVISMRKANRREQEIYKKRLGET